MGDVRELQAGETGRAARALLELRPHVGDAAALVARADAQRAEGYRIVASFEEGAEEASGAAGFRVMEMLMWGRVLYVDDLVTAERWRSSGYGTALERHLARLAAAAGCTQVRLDSGVQRRRAHRFYFRRGYAIESFNFARRLDAGENPSR